MRNIFKLFQIYILLLLLNPPIGNSMDKKNNFVLDLFSSTSVLDPAEIYSAGQYIVVSHLVRPLTKFNKEAQIEGDLVESWRIKDDFKEFHFKIKDDAKWSDGTAIKSNDVSNSISRQKRLKTANHFNFSIIKEVKVVDERNFIIFLKDRDVSFIRQVSYPEFGLISEIDSHKNREPLKLKKVSGPYSLSEKLENGGFVLTKNKFYNDFHSEAPQNIEFRWSKGSEKNRGILDGSIDFAIPFGSINNDLMKEFEKNKNLKVAHPHIGYSFWLTINPGSEIFKNKETRNWLQTLLATKNYNLSDYDAGWEHSSQLYLPDGLGRPSNQEIDSLWKKIEANKRAAKIKGKIRILAQNDFPFTKVIEKILKENEIDYTIDFVSSADDFFKAMKTHQYDIIQTRNDFSSADLHENLQTTFNPNGPLVLTSKEKNQYQAELRKALNTESEKDRHQIYRDIAKDILLEGYVIPIAYNRIFFVHKATIDISEWSNLFPELSAWKIKIKK